MPYASINEIGGKTVVWNQLLASLSNWICNTTYGTYTRNQDGSITYTVTNAQPSTSFFLPAEYTETVIKTTHKYYLAFDVIPLSTTVRFAYNAGNNGTNWSGLTVGTRTLLNKIWEPAADETAKTKYLHVAYVNGESGVSTLYSAMLIDLTLMFGSGNEPATVSEFESMFPNIDPAYNAGELRSAGVTEAVSEGRNLVGLTGRTLGTTTEGGAAVAKQWDTSKYYLGCTANGAYYPQYITSYSIDGDKVSCVAISPGYGIGVPVKLTKGETYRITVYSDDAYQCQSIAFYDKAGYYVSTSYTTSITKTVSFVMPSDAEIALVVYRAGNAAGPVTPPVTLTNDYIMLERGSTATAYTPYFSRTLPIPSAIQSLPGYGWSAGTAYNAVSLAQGKNTQRVGKIVLDGVTANRRLDGAWGTTAPNVFYASNLPFNRTGNIQKVICDRFIPTSGSVTTMPPYTFMGGSGAPNTISFAFPTSITTLQDANTWLANNNTTIYYALAEPVETDISEYLTGDNLIEVEPGGSLTFKNQNGDDWRVPVPNEETFLVQAAPELPTTDGTYTLQCTVTDGTPSVTWVTA
jgi:hypothetical protein